MPLKAPRFIHIQTPGGKFNGFSVYFYQEEEDVPKGEMRYTIAMCSAKDHFCRRLAREQCTQRAEEMRCRVVDFPMMLADVYATSKGRPPAPDARWASNQWAWIWKYFL